MLSLPYYLGCPQWQHPDWQGRLPAGPSSLAQYSRVFNTVEGNTTFYATPTSAQCEVWRSQVPECFRFLFKFPREISHDALLARTDPQVRRFLATLAPLEDVFGPFLLQLPAAFGPQHLANLWGFLDRLPDALTCTVEMRHPAFFEKGEAERALNQGLREREVARVCFDSRPLFAADPVDESTRDAQRKKPKLPVHVLPVARANPVVRFIGHPELEANREYLAPWVPRMANWIAEGRKPYMFIHMPDNGQALSLVQLWQGLLREKVPELPELGLADQVDQPGLV